MPGKRSRRKQRKQRQLEGFDEEQQRRELFHVLSMWAGAYPDGFRCEVGAVQGDVIGRHPELWYPYMSATPAVGPASGWAVAMSRMPFADAEEAANEGSQVIHDVITSFAGVFAHTGVWHEGDAPDAESG